MGTQGRDQQLLDDRAISNEYEASEVPPQHQQAIAGRQERHQAVGLLEKGGDLLKKFPWLLHCHHAPARQFLDHYMEGTGEEITLTKEQMARVTASLGMPKQMQTALAELLPQAQAAGKELRKTMTVVSHGESRQSCSLGTFTVEYKGDLIAKPDGTWVFEGTMKFYDFWDFDPKPGGRNGEKMVRIANKFLTGKPFAIKSEELPMRFSPALNGRHGYNYGDHLSPDQLKEPTVPVADFEGRINGPPDMSVADILFPFMAEIVGVTGVFRDPVDDQKTE